MVRAFYQPVENWMIALRRLTYCGPLLLTGNQPEGGGKHAKFKYHEFVHFRFHFKV